MHRTYLGPYREAKVNLTHYKGRIRRGQRIKVTAEEAEAMDKLPLSWSNESKPAKAVAAISLDDAVTVIKKKRKRKSRSKSRRK